jgi:hypothetical protein
VEPLNTPLVRVGNEEYIIDSVFPSEAKAKKSVALAIKGAAEHLGHTASLSHVFYPPGMLDL